MFNKAAILLLTKLGNASVHMCKTVCSHLGTNVFERVTGAFD